MYLQRNTSVESFYTKVSEMKAQEKDALDI